MVVVAGRGGEGRGWAEVAVEMVVDGVGRSPTTPTLSEVAVASTDLEGVMGFEPPTWRPIVKGTSPRPGESVMISSLEHTAMTCN